MTKETKNETMRILPGTPEMEAFLQAGYSMDIEEAKRIVKEHDTNPSSVPYDVFKNAKAMIAAYNATPKVISKTPGWKREPV
jgi:hypothetical protein